tara:strand:+ start:172 stop:1302 length:1131 start_codon:yes stop_codon:yes gene_type:complete
MQHLNLIIEAINDLGGRASLSEIYQSINKNHSVPEPSIRRTIYQHASECDAYLINKEDIFFAPEGKGEGIWAVRSNSYDEFIFKPGQKILRKELHKKLGGIEQGGISPTLTGHILLFSDKKQGEEFGYHNGWDGEIFLYYGSGQLGDMEFTKRNKSLLDHHKDGRRVHLFNGAKGEVTYEGQFELDEKKPFQLIEDYDKENTERVAIVFRLLPVREKLNSLPKSNIKIFKKDKIEITNIEKLKTESSFVRSVSETTAERKESKLVTSYEEFLKKNKLPRLSCLKITIGGENKILKTDGWVVDTNSLIEAKSSTSRNSIRTAIGQLFDYKFLIEAQNMKVDDLYILVPKKPSQSICTLLEKLDIGLIYKSSSEFIKA